MELVQAIEAIVGGSNVVTQPDELAALSGDLVHAADIPAELAVAPGTVDELCAVVREAYAARRPIVTRGAGWSYTRAHVPTRPGTVLIDSRRLDAIVEVDARDLFATVEAGCTWEHVASSLAGHGVRPLFWGPLSGHRATVGATCSQDAVFFGSARHGRVAPSVLGFDVVRPDGTLLGTGSRARDGDPPFTAAFGPDLTGLFVGDAGAFGPKARVTLALEPLLPSTWSLSFETPELSTAVELLCELARTGLASELYAYDANHHRLIADAGVATLDPHGASVHATLEREGDADALRAIASARAREVAPDVPNAIAADPFGATKTIFASVRGTLLPPVQALVAPSRAAAALELLERAAPDAWRFATIAGTRELVLEASVPVGDEPRADAVRRRESLLELLDPLGAGHLQLGKAYPYLPRLTEPAAAAALALKRVLDPEGLFNPDALGLTR